MRRRALLHLAGGSLLAGALPATAGAIPRRIVSLDYGIASTLLSLGVVPAAVASLADWPKWVVEPAMPDGVIDLGNSWEVNFEILTALKPDLILTTPYLDASLPRLEAVSRVLRLPVFSPDGGAILPSAIAATRVLAERIGRAAEGERFLADADAAFEACRRRLAGREQPPLAFVNFMDARHARIYGPPGMFHGVLTRLGLVNAWTQESNYWGFQTIGIEELARVRDSRARLFALEPLPPDVLPKLAESPLWQALPFARPGHFEVMPAALMFGMVNEALRFARLLTERLEAAA
ncbi:ABC transporter substrate-binding protein [Ensifer soli]|uniref:ABC transporter substrate-binding protein n=1 Tax=Ciceribacter sp. sgz301302 TaxID=3342379 RepID=UPI0035B7EA96